MMVRLFVCASLLALASGLSGCMQGSYAEVASRSPEKIMELQDIDVAAMYGTTHDPKTFYRASTAEKFRNEAMRRGLYTPEQWALIDARQVQIGQPEHLVWASWGPPDHVNTLTLADGERRALSWERLSSIVYIEHGKVAAILD